MCPRLKCHLRTYSLLRDQRDSSISQFMIKIEMILPCSPICACIFRCVYVAFFSSADGQVIQSVSIDLVEPILACSCQRGGEGSRPVCSAALGWSAIVYLANGTSKWSCINHLFILCVTHKLRQRAWHGTITHPKRVELRLSIANVSINIFGHVTHHTEQQLCRRINGNKIFHAE